MKKILMYGPAYGHNAEPFVEFFNNQKTIQFTYFYRGKNDFENKYPNVTFVKIEAKLKSIIRLAKVIHDDYDLIWIHGGYSLLMLIFVIVFKNKKSKLNLNIWGEAMPNKIISNTIYGYLYRMVLKYVDFIQCNWYGTYNILVNNLSSTLANKTVVLPWGLATEFFEDSIVCEPEYETKLLIEKVKGKKSFFFPKSILSASGHDIVIDTVEKLVKNGYKSFLVVFWTGNTNNHELLEKYKRKIDEASLSEYISIPPHSFIPFAEMKYIWKHIDIGLQIAIHDQLSTSFLEPMIMKKPFIATGIEPYRIYEKKFDLNLELSELTVDDIFHHMKKYLDGYTISELEAEKRNKIVASNFNFKINIEKTLNYFKNADN